jgi:rRNA-processing protein FCF1
MKKPKIYLETTLFSFYFSDDSPEKRCDTIKLFEEIKEGRYDPYTSQYVVEELEQAPEQKAALM